MNKKGFVYIPLLIIVFLATAGIGAYYYFTGEQMAAPKPQVNTDAQKSETAQSETFNPRIAGIETELGYAKQSGGMTLQNYNEIKKALDDMEVAGADAKKINSLRATLESIDVGGKKSAMPSSLPSKTSTSPTPSYNGSQPTPSPTIKTTLPMFVTWNYEQNIWKPSATPPVCPPLVFESPVDLGKATSILYPGQMRGPSINDYKAHGGFRFDNQSSQDIEVRSPADAYIWRGARFLLNGQIQYGFDLISECGIMHRFGHLYELAPKFLELAEKMRPAVEGDSRTSDLVPFQKVSKGELIATKIGIPGNPGMDWGVYDLRKINQAAENSEYRTLHYFQWWYDYHGLCWLDLLAPADQALAKALPGGDGKMGKTSDYCK